MKPFIQSNYEMWSNYKPYTSGDKLLIEEPCVPFIVHVNSIFSIILNQAKHYTPVWLSSRSLNMELLKSYLPNAESSKLASLSLIENIMLFMKTLKYFFTLKDTRDILLLKYDQVKYGDIIYDTYLMEEKVATIKKINLKLLKIIHSCLFRHERVLKTLRSDNFKGVLVSHQIDINSGVMLRVALRYGLKGYLRTGHHQSTLRCLSKIDEVYNYEYKPFPEDIKQIERLLGSQLDKSFKLIMNKQISGKGDADGKYAYSPQNKFYTSRSNFNKDYKLDSKKKNIFIMLHALNDYPHVLFRHMIFKDFYGWFTETLDLAKTIKNVNWIFKQHPSIRFYQIKDISFNTIFQNTPNNIVYINERNQIDTRSLIHCADVIITCLGSAGFEFPAIAGIPSILASESFYSELGFTIEPQTKEKYFGILKNLNTVKKLTKKQQKIARTAYLHIYEFSRISMSSCPMLSLEDQNDSNVYNNYWQKVTKLYKIQGNRITNEVKSYIRKVAKPDFKRLDSLEEFKKNNLSI